MSSVGRGSSGKKHDGHLVGKRVRGRDGGRRGSQEFGDIVVNRLHSPVMLRDEMRECPRREVRWEVEA